MGKHSINIIPVVFITNESLQKLTPADNITELGSRLYQLLETQQQYTTSLYRKYKLTVTDRHYAQQIFQLTAAAPATTIARAKRKK